MSPGASILVIIIIIVINTCILHNFSIDLEVPKIVVGWFL